MSVLLGIVYVIHVLISLFLILVVLLQQGKGADLSVFGGGASQAAFGARGAANIFNKMTVVCFIGFILTTLSIGFLQGRGESSVMSGVVADDVVEEAPVSLDEIDALSDDATEAVEDGAENVGAAVEDAAEAASDAAGAAAEAVEEATSSDDGDGTSGSQNGSN